MSATGNSSSSLSVLSEVSESIKKFGEKNTIEILRAARHNNEKLEHIDSVIGIVCNHLGFKSDKLQERNKNTKRLVVIKFISYYSYCVVGSHKIKGQKIAIYFSDIAGRLNRAYPLVNKYCKEMIVKKNDKSDEYFQGHFKALDVQIKKYLQSLK